MKKVLGLILFMLLIFCLFQTNVFASSVPLGSVTASITKEKITPGENVTVTINFGTELGAYTFDVAYDNNIFEYVSSEGGTENDNGTRVRVIYYDSSGGSNPRTNMSVTFKAKEEIVTTNPTDFSITAEGLSNSDASQQYDDISVPIKKSLTVEPKYVDYTLDFKYSGEIIINKEKEMELITKSSMGKNYDHIKMKVEVTQKPSDNATVQLLATEKTRQETDLIKDGWGGIDGYSLGGKNVEQILAVRALFNEKGNYAIKVTLEDKDDGNKVIATKEFKFTVKETSQNNNSTTQDKNEITGETTNKNEQVNDKVNTQEEMPENLPKTGMTKYVYLITAISVLGAGYLVLKNTNKTSN